MTVLNVVKFFSKSWKGSCWSIKEDKNNIESKLLSLNCSKAKKKLGWTPKISTKEALQVSRDWYYSFYKKPRDVITFKQIMKYEKKIK